ncbi:hypothetical protein LEP1GSC187_0284 [Leptospira santarosai str. ZUN179]|uniref:Uncharacterized protein n=1 Tax=Leptospira santarosai str. ZUN179 TaxID=1049985 RepID=M6UUA2_9LEPT|nr:hypothetical protein LEP1GSC187_0284 [Leptospira santarosai str. ZUN179]
MRVSRWGIIRIHNKEEWEMNLKNENIEHFRNGGRFKWNGILFELKDRNFVMRPVGVDTSLFCRSLRHYPFMMLKRIIRGEWGKKVD